MSEHLYTFINPCNLKHLDTIQHVLDNHGVIALSMGTSWAFCCHYTSKKGIEKLRRLNPNHPDNRPFSIICSNISMVSSIGTIENQNYRIVNKILPGPFTIILNSNRQLAKRLGERRQTVGVRIPNDPLALEIIQHCGHPLVATSVPVMEDGQVYTMGYQIFEEYSHGLDLVVDLGDEVPGNETTVLDLTGHEIVVIREGAGNLADL